MLAYLFWHRPRPGVEQGAYEEAQRAFHRELGIESACFRIATLPFAEAGGYEDWYLVADWGGLGELNERAVDPRRRSSHDEAAALAAEGWGGVYSLQRGGPTIPPAVEWADKPHNRVGADFIADLGAEAVWRRELVLGPAPEFCLGSSAPTSDRQAVFATG